MKEEIIHDFREHHTDVTVDFEVQMDPATLQHFRGLSGAWLGDVWIVFGCGFGGLGGAPKGWGMNAGP